MSTIPYDCADCERTQELDIDLAALSEDGAISVQMIEQHMWEDGKFARCENCKRGLTSEHVFELIEDFLRDGGL